MSDDINQATDNNSENVYADDSNFRIRNILEHIHEQIKPLSGSSGAERAELLKFSKPPINLFNPNYFKSGLVNNQSQSTPLRFRRYNENTDKATTNKMIIMISSDRSGLGKTYLATLINDLFENNGQNKVNSKVVSFSEPLKIAFDKIALGPKNNSDDEVTADLKDLYRKSILCNNFDSVDKKDSPYLWDILDRSNKQKFRKIMTNIGESFDLDCYRFHELFDKNRKDLKMLIKYNLREYHPVAKHILEQINSFKSNQSSDSLDLLIFDDLRHIREIHAVNSLAMHYGGIKVLHIHLSDINLNIHPIINVKGYCDILLHIESIDGEIPKIKSAYIHDKITRICGMENSSSIILNKCHDKYSYVNIPQEFYDMTFTTTISYYIPDMKSLNRHKYASRRESINSVHIYQRLATSSESKKSKSLISLNDDRFYSDKTINNIKYYKIDKFFNPNSIIKFSFNSYWAKDYLEYHKVYATEQFCCPIGFEDNSTTILKTSSETNADDQNRFKMGALLTCVFNSDFDAGFTTFSYDGDPVETNLNLWESFKQVCN